MNLGSIAQPYLVVLLAVLLDAAGLDLLEEVLDPFTSNGDLGPKQWHTTGHAVDSLAVHLDVKRHQPGRWELVVLPLRNDIVRGVAVVSVDGHLEGSHAGGSVAVLVGNSVECLLFYSHATIYFGRKFFAILGLCFGFFSWQKDDA